MDSSPSFPRSRVVIFSLLPVVVFLLLGEIGLRVYDWSREASSHARAYWYWGYAQDKYLGYRGRPNTDIVLAGGNHLDTNSAGFRDAALPLSVPGRRLIICMGESSTFGTGAKNRLTTYPHQLQAILQQHDPRFVVYNAGIPGANTVDNAQRLSLALLKYKPEAVIYMGFIADVNVYLTRLENNLDLNLYPRYLALLPTTFWNSFWLRSSLLAAIASRISGKVPLDRQSDLPIPAATGGPTPRGGEVFRDRIATMKFLCDRHNVQLMWVDQVVDYSRRNDVDAVKKSRAMLHDELAKDGIPLLQAAEIYNFRQYPLLDDVHFDDKGNRYLASLLAPQILAQLDRAGSSHAASSSTLK